jgi:hypothetical protein
VTCPLFPPAAALGDYLVERAGIRRMRLQFAFITALFISIRSRMEMGGMPG